MAGFAGCDPSGTRPDWSAAERTLNYTSNYAKLPNRFSEQAILEQWQPYPRKTGPATVNFTGMWTAYNSALLLV